MEMTIDEAHQILSNGLANAPSEHEWCMAFKLAIDTVRKYQIMKAKYNARLKADMVAMLTELQLEIESYKLSEPTLKTEYDQGLFDAQNGMIEEIGRIIQEKINVLKSESEV